MSLVLLCLNFTATIAQPVSASYSPPRQAPSQVQNAGGSNEERTKTAKQLFDQSIQLFNQGTAESLRQAAEKLQAAVKLFRALNDRPMEAAALLVWGRIANLLGEQQQALEFYNLALPIFKQFGDRSGEAMTLNNLGMLYAGLGQRAKALEFFNLALQIFKEVKDQSSEALALNNIGLVYGDLGERQKALAFYTLALRIIKAVGDRNAEATTTNNIGTIYWMIGEQQKAMEFYSLALPIYREVGDLDGEATTLASFGAAYFYLGEQQKALEFYNLALPIFKKVGNRSSEAGTHNNIGAVYDALGEKQKALASYNLALPIYREVGDLDGEATTLNNLGKVYADLSEKQKALDFFNQALPIHRKVGNRNMEATTLANLGTVYLALAEQQKALTFFNLALPIAKAVGDRNGEASTLNNIGLVYSSLGEQQKALEFYRLALQIHREIGNRNMEAITLNNIGGVYSSLDEQQKALEAFNLALPIAKVIGDRNTEALTLNNLGQLYSRSGQKQKAMELYNLALPIMKETGNRNMEATTLNNLMFVWEALQQPRLATLFGKQAINVYQSLRTDIRGLDKEIQQTFLNSIQNAYRKLSDLLIAQGRLPEAEFVINLLKQDEYFEYVRRDKEEAKSEARVALSPDEARLIKRYNEISDRITAIGAQLGVLRSKAEKQTISAEESAQLAAIEKDLEAANFQFQQFLVQMTEELKKTTNADRVNFIAESQALMSDLKELGNNTVAIYTVVSDDKYSAIVVTPDTQVARQVSIKAADLNRKVIAFHDVLQNPSVDPLPLAQELYKILIAPIAKDLEGARAETLMWSLDGTLRYLPIAALHDGKQYLVEKYRNVIFTLASNARLKDVPNPTWRGLGLGMSKRTAEFLPLPAVPVELRSIIHDTAVKESQGILEGKILMDDDFTSDAMKTALREKYPLVHIASHFRFQPGDETNSYLLLGQGVMTIAEIKRLTNVFDKVDLLTLSACNTAMSGADAQGKEVEGFAVLAQRQGAKAVMATLWSVADQSTQLLMQEFYRLHQTQKGITKVEALRQAQMALLKGNLKRVTTDSTNRRPEVNGSPVFKVDPNAPFSHPYFWAPFILIGNFR